VVKRLRRSCYPTINLPPNGRVITRPFGKQLRKIPPFVGLFTFLFVVLFVKIPLKT
jgi:hypothetical protein